jgi:hypothetical protein
MTVATVSLLASTLVATSAAIASTTPTCGGRDATLVGTPGDDVLIGTPGRDVIVGLGGDDLIRGHGGRDIICGGAGNDTIYGGKGRDRLRGGPGADRVHRGGRMTTLLEDSPQEGADLAYFEEIGFAPEYGDQVRMIHKWTDDVRLAVHGSPTDADLETIDRVIADLDGLLDPIEVRLVTAGQNADVYFAKRSEFSSLDPQYVSPNLGYFDVRWNGHGVIYTATVLISTEVTQSVRDHLIREEITQSLGLMSDSWSHPRSMFYQGWSETHSFSALDETLVRLLYRQELVPGMPEDEAMAVLRGS